MAPQDHAVGRQAMAAAWGASSDTMTPSKDPPLMPGPGSLDRLVACPRCDALHRLTEPLPGQRATCHRCDAVLIAPRRRAGMTIIAMSASIVVLAVATLVLPFLSISRRGLSNDATLLDAATAFSGVPFVFLSLAVLTVTVLLPPTRAVLILYVLTPLVFDRKPPPRALAAFRLVEQLRPWSMAEIFVIGCVVSLVELRELALIDLGPAFWMFATLVVLGVIQDTVTCSYSVWKALDRNSAA